MARRKDEASMEKETPNYSLNKKAVEDLVSASKENTPEYSEEELARYRKKGGFQLASWQKAVLLKLWFPGMVCFFFIWGLGLYIPSTLDLFFVTALAMGFVTDILENNIFRFIATTEGANDRWMMFPKKGYMSLVWNILYAFLLMTLVYLLYNMINIVAVSFTGNRDSVPFGVEPVTFGVFYFGFDMLFLSVKKLLKKIVADAKENVKKGV